MIFYYAFVLSLPLVSHPIFGSEAGGLTVSKYLGLVCLGYALLMPGRRSPQFFATPQARWYAAFYGLIALSYGLSLLDSRRGEWAVFVLYTSQVVFFVTTSILVNSLARLRKVLLVAIGSVAIASLYVLREWWAGSAEYGAGYRPGYVTGDPNFYAASALTCLPLAFGWALGASRRWERALCLGALLLGLAGTMVAASRGGFLGLLLGLTVFVWHSRYRGKALAVVSGALVIFLLVSPTSPLQRLVNPQHGDVEARDARFQLWEAALNMVSSNPIFGVGLGNFKAYARAYSDLPPELELISHNGYLDVATEVGLPGLVALLGVIYGSARTAGRVRRRAGKEGAILLQQAALGVEAAVVGFSVALLFVSGLSLKLFWLMIFLSMRLPALLEAKRPVVRQAA